MPDLRALIDDRRARVGVIGLGHVGLPMATAARRAGFDVLGFDVDAELVARLATAEGLDATTDLSRLGEADVLLVCVPTPLDAHNEPDLTPVEQAARAIAATLREGQLVVLESTTWPGTTRDVVVPILAASGLRSGVDVFVAYSPERHDPGRVDVTTADIPRLVGGVDDASGEMAELFYGAIVRDVVGVGSADVAEAAKLLENAYRAVNIAMVNEMKVILTAMGLDIEEVIDAASTKPFGFQAFRPGPGLGGHCIPIDPFYFAWKARQVGHEARFVRLAGEINRSMPDFVVARAAEALALSGQAVRGARLLVLGLAYKPDTDDVRESPSFVLIDRFQRLGASVDYHDPHVPAHGDMRSVELSDEAMAGYDAVIIATAHAAVDYDRLGTTARLIVDTRAAMRGRPGNVVTA